MNVVRDRIARRAAALVSAGVHVGIEAAVRDAAHQLGFVHGAPLPTAGEVRRHLGGMAREALGEEAYRAGIAAHFALAAHVMGLLERAFGARTLLCGRAARGQFDGGAELHVRIYARVPLDALARALVDGGLPEPSFETLETSHGRANRLRFEVDGADLCVLRCLPEWWDAREDDLVTGRRTRVLDLPSVERMAGEAGPE